MAKLKMSKYEKKDELVGVDKALTAECVYTAQEAIEALCQEYGASSDFLREGLQALENGQEYHYADDYSEYSNRGRAFLDVDPIKMTMDWVTVSRHTVHMQFVRKGGALMLQFWRKKNNDESNYFYPGVRRAIGDEQNVDL